MDIKISRISIADISADAIVLPANTNLAEGRGASAAIFKKAGRDNLKKACQEICEKYRRDHRVIKVGTAVVTPAYDLNAKYIIHAIVPKWIDGKHNERELLGAAYISSLELSDSLGCKSIAFPLLASGNNGYGTELAFRIAKECIEGYRTTNQLRTVYLVLHGRKAVEVAKEYGLMAEESKEPGNEFHSNENLKELLTVNFPKNGVNKKIHVLEGSICSIQDQVDLLVCSAYKESYYPRKGTLLGALQYEKNISVEQLAKRPALDLRERGCWISDETGKCFARIACVEILSLREKNNMDGKVEKLLASTFSTLKYMCEQASIEGIPIHNMVLPILGTGAQKIDMNYVVPVLLAQMRQTMDSIDQLTDVYIVERSPEKARRFVEILSRLIKDSGQETPDVFISYSSKQHSMAHQIFEKLTDRGITCWIAPESISPGSDYAEEIPEGIGNTKLTVLVLTPDAVCSQWVRKEVGASIGAGHILVPYQEEPFAIGKSFMFLLEGEQILEAWKESEDSLSVLAEWVSKKLAK